MADKAYEPRLKTVYRERIRAALAGLIETMLDGLDEEMSEEEAAPGGDLAIRIHFEARGISPAGFLVYPFYL